MPSKSLIILLSLVFIISGCGTDEPDNANHTLKSVFVGSTQISITGELTTGLPVDQSITLIFSSAVDQSVAESAILLKQGEIIQDISISFLNGNKSVIVFLSTPLTPNTIYTLELTESLTGEPQTLQFKTALGNLLLTSIIINSIDVTSKSPVLDVPMAFSTTVNFSLPVTQASLRSAIALTGPTAPSFQIIFSNENKTAVITTAEPLAYLSKYIFTISDKLKGVEGEGFSTRTKTLYTAIDYSLKKPQLPNDEDDDNDNTNDLLSVVQKQTFKYFWDFAQPASGMARERNTSGNLVTSGGSGFGIMALIVGMERNFISRAQGLERMDRILDFLENADKFHGAWSHWIDGNSGDVIPFGTNDNGGDLVETAFLAEGLITFRQYLNNTAEEQALKNRINALWQAIEWDWYRQDNQDVLYWHWSPDKNWIMNHQISGWNEALIIYVLAASAPADNTIPKTVYEKGWARSGGIRNGSTYEGITLPLGFSWGGPLFFTHYSFLGLNPHNLSDQYASSYWTQNVNHSLINYKYCVRNPKQFAGYGEDCWGLTASDSNVGGYNAHSPTNDLGVITPTAALSSFPYTPEESMGALKFFYYTMGDRLWGEYGFYDAFNPSENWYADSYLAIDQGPIIVMIENYRTGLLWNLFMTAPEVQTGLTNLGFTSFDIP